MKICDTRDHGEIVFEDRDCEACKTIDDLKQQIKELEAELQEAQDHAQE